MGRQASAKEAGASIPIGIADEPASPTHMELKSVFDSGPFQHGQLQLFEGVEKHLSKDFYKEVYDDTKHA